MSGKDGRTEKATPQRRRKAREEGQVARSQEVAVAGSLLGLVITLALAGPSLVDRSMAEVQAFVVMAPTASLDTAAARGLSFATALAWPFMAVAVVTAFLAGVSQVGIKFNAKLAMPRAKNLSLKRGLERFRPSVASWELARSVLKLAALGVVIWPTLTAWRSHMANDRTLASALERFGSVFGGVLVRAAILALVIAIADWTYQRRRTEKKMMMTRQDLKREFRDSEGDPHLKATRRRRQQALSRNRMLRDVGHADVVVANPTHVAVALRYDATDGAPRIVAKGAGHLAQRIKDVARRHGVPVTTDVPLARTLYHRCQPGQFVPAALYEAVAVVLAHAYRRTGRQPGSRRVLGARAA